MAAEMGKTLEKNKQTTVPKVRVGGIQWIYLWVLLFAGFIAEKMQEHITGIFKKFF